MKIIYKDSDERVVVITPAPTCPYTIEEIADKDVPAGLPYKIVADDIIPSDKTFRAAWTVDVLELTDGVGAVSHEFTRG
jgi:hypothetical protein